MTSRTWIRTVLGIATIAASLTIPGRAGAQNPDVCGTSRVTQPAAVTIKTLPPVAGFVVEIDGQRFTTGQDGVAATGLVKSCVISRSIVVPSTTIEAGAGRRLQFTRFFPNTDQTYTAAFNDERLVNIAFQDPKGAPVDPSRVQSVSIGSSIGERIKIAPPEPRWLLGGRVISDFDALKVRPVYWTTTAAKVDGLNVVNRSEVKFFPSEDAAPVVRLLLFPVDVEVSDTFFGTPVGDRVEMEYPNGHVEVLDLDGSGRLKLKGVARGQYDMTVRGGAIKVRVPVSITKPQKVDLQVLSYLDVALVGGGVLLLALVIVWTGRRNQHRRSRAAKSSAKGHDAQVGAEHHPRQLVISK